MASRRIPSRCSPTQGIILATRLDFDRVGAHVLARLNPTARYTYGFRSASILAALLNGVILLVATGAIAWEAVQRLFEPGEVAGITVMVVAAAGIVVNGASAWLLMAGQKGDLNIRGAFFHMAGDAAVSLRRRDCRRPHHPDRLELARSGREHLHIGGDRLGNLEPPARGREPCAQRGPVRNRS